MIASIALYIVAVTGGAANSPAQTSSLVYVRDYGSFADCQAAAKNAKTTLIYGDAQNAGLLGVCIDRTGYAKLSRKGPPRRPAQKVKH